MDAPNEKLQELQQLPQFPAVATKVLRVLSHDDANVSEISDFIRADSALAAGLLRTANSALYAFPSPITSIQNALMMLGFDEVWRFVLTFSTQNFFQTSMRLDLLRGMWRHSLACAWISEELSAACSLSQGRGDPAYTAGLLHDIGRLGLFVLHPREYAEMISGPAAIAQRITPRPSRYKTRSYPNSFPYPRPPRAERHQPLSIGRAHV